MLGIFRVHLQQLIKNWTKPAPFSLISGVLTDLSHSCTDLIVENALLRQQLIVLYRQVKRPPHTNRDRFWLILLAHFSKFWKQAVHIVQPDTLIHWHRELFRFYWRLKSQNKQNKPKISLETVTLIRRMARENTLWGAELIRGELLKLGIRVSKLTIQKYMSKVRGSPSSNQSWLAFIRNHARDIWACDFTVVYDWLFRAWYIFVVLELKTRRIVHMGVTTSPTDEWTALQLREATPWNQGPKYLIHNRDSKYGSHFSAVAGGSGIRELRSDYSFQSKTPYRAPRANAFCERFMGSLKRECIDHMLIFHGQHLRQVVNEYTVYYNHDRPHQGICQQIPDHFDQSQINRTGEIIGRPIPAGLHNSYSHVVPLISSG